MNKAPKFFADFKIGPFAEKKAEALVNHARYLREKVDGYMVPDYKYIAIAREPISWFKSAVNYFTSEKGSRFWLNGKRAVSNGLLRK